MRLIGIWLAGAVGVALCAFWAAAPLEIRQPIDVAAALMVSSDQPQTVAPRATIDADAFSALIWNPPLSAPPQQVAAAPEPLRRGGPQLELIAIIEEKGQRRAAIYDPQSDRTLIVSSGDRVQHQTVTAIGTDTVELSGGVSLRLKEDRSG